MIYKNIKTGYCFETSANIKGENWQLISKEKQEIKKKLAKKIPKK